jgi:hypothetical protein
MQSWQIVILVLLAAVVAVVAGGLIYQQIKSWRLRHHYGSEYDRTVVQFGDRRRAEAELARRQERIRGLDLRPLSASDRVLFAEHWRQCQAQFVEDPEGAIASADRLLTDIIRARGYSADNPQERIADISAAYPDHVNSYRLANEAVSRQRHGQASTEDLRKAFIHFRELFDQILGEHDEELKRAS